jgi:hypothetical protein
MLYSEQNKWMFIHVPKNAGTSLQANYTDMGYDDRGLLSFDSRLENRVKAKVEHYFPKGDVVHNKWSYFKNNSKFEGFTPIALLRNPWDRALSIYTFSLERAKKELGSEWANYDHPILVNQGFKRAWMEGGYFVDNHAKSTEYNEETKRAWSYNEDQYSWLQGEGQWFRLEDQLEEICKFTGLENPPKLNTSKRLDYRLYYDDELAERIAKLFARDIELGGYSF